MKPWMLEAMGPDGARLHGAGLARPEAWWKVRAGGGRCVLGEGLCVC